MTARLIFRLIVFLHLPFLSGRGGKALSARAEELGVEHLIMFSRNKEEDFLALTGRLDISPDETAFIGDDMIDLPAMARAGFTACPSDAVPEVRARVDRILHTPGGGGVLREVVELILKARGAWPH